MKLSSSLPVVVRACFFSEASLTESVLPFVNWDCPSSLFPKRRNSPVVDVRVASISWAPLPNFRTTSKTRCPRSVSGICFCVLLCDMVRTLQMYLPESIRGIVRCANPACVSNAGEPVEPKFLVERQDPLRLRCFYCVRIMEKQDVLKQF